jgi:hypothetical protein
MRPSGEQYKNCSPRKKQSNPSTILLRGAPAGSKHLYKITAMKTMFVVADDNGCRLTFLPWSSRQIVLRLVNALLGLRHLALRRVFRNFLAYCHTERFQGE